uniref:Uncharacterized protein n=1 Tax=Pararge aegeria TaxID=116150 RepID=S4NWN7_9NEOP
MSLPLQFLMRKYDYTNSFTICALVTALDYRILAPKNGTVTIMGSRCAQIDDKRTCLLLFMTRCRILYT